MCGTGNGSVLAMMQLHQQELLRMAVVLVLVDVRVLMVAATTSSIGAQKSHDGSIVE